MSHFFLYFRRYLCFVAGFTFVFLGKLNAQNLIQNPSFESSQKCSNKVGNFNEDITDWFNPSQGTSDYFNDCSEEMHTSQNFIGRQTVYDGKAFAGFYMYGPDNYREYITASILEPLEQGKRYKISFMVSLAEKSGLSVDQFEILFTENNPKWETNKNIEIENLKEENHLNFVRSSNPVFYSNKTEWIRVSADFVANGTEKFMTLGNFKRNLATKTEETGQHQRKAAYYYFDMVSLTKDTYQFNLDEIYVVKDFLFTPDSFEIHKGSKSQLKALLTHLKRNPELNLTIYGHSDGKGNKNYNKELSEKRAKAVGEFLLDNGLGFDRISWRGYGDKIPLTTNHTKTKNLQNKRLEFVVSKGKQNGYANSMFEDQE